MIPQRADEVNRLLVDKDQLSVLPRVIHPGNRRHENHPSVGQSSVQVLLATLKHGFENKVANRSLVVTFKVRRNFM